MDALEFSGFEKSDPALDAVAELVERESAIGKTAVCSLSSGSVSSMFSYIGTDSGFGNSINFSGQLTLSWRRQTS